MTKALHAARCVSQNLANASFQPIWITDSLLAETFRRFASQHIRHGSHVPGPLEARRRASKRRNTNFAHTQPQAAPVDPAVLFAERPSNEWWQSSGEAVHEHAVPQLMPSWLLRPPDPPSVVLDDPVGELQILDSSVIPDEASSTEHLLALIARCESTEKLRELVQNNVIQLHQDKDVREAICARVVDMNSYQHTNVADFIVDPVFHPPGSGNHSLILSLLQRQPLSSEAFKILDKSYCRAAQLGLISPAAMEEIFHVLLRTTVKTGGEEDVIRNMEDVFTVTTTLLKSFDESGIYRLTDLGREFSTRLASVIAAAAPTSAASMFSSYMHRKALFLNSDVERLLCSWLTETTAAPDGHLESAVAELLQSMDTQDAYSIIMRTTSRLLYTVWTRGVGRPSLVLLCDALKTIGIGETLRTLPSTGSEAAWIGLSQGCNSSLTQAENTCVAVWLLHVLQNRESDSEESDTQFRDAVGHLSLLLNPNAGENIFECLILNLKNMPLPNTASLLSLLVRVSRLGDKQHPLLQYLPSRSLIALLDRDYYEWVRKRARPELNRMAEAVNADIHKFKHLARALIHKDKLLWTLVTRILRHNRPFRRALSQSSTTTPVLLARTEPDLQKEQSHDPPTAIEPSDALEVLNYITIAFGLTKASSPRMALNKVLECYGYLVWCEAPIQAPFTRALWHAGVAGFAYRGGPPATQMAYILDKIRKVEGDDVAQALLRNGVFREQREKSILALDWSDDELHLLEVGADGSGGSGIEQQLDSGLRDLIDSSGLSADQPLATEDTDLLYHQMVTDIEEPEREIGKNQRNVFVDLSTAMDQSVNEQEEDDDNDNDDDDDDNEKILGQQTAVADTVSTAPKDWRRPISKGTRKVDGKRVGTWELLYRI